MRAVVGVLTLAASALGGHASSCVSNGTSSVAFGARAVAAYTAGEFELAYSCALRAVELSAPRVGSAALWAFSVTQARVGREAALRHFFLPTLAMDATTADASRGGGLSNDATLWFEPSAEAPDYLQQLFSRNRDARLRDEADGEALSSPLRLTRAKMAFLAAATKAARAPGADAARHTPQRDMISAVACLMWANQLEYLQERGVGRFAEAVVAIRRLAASSWLLGLPPGRMPLAIVFTDAFAAFAGEAEDRSLPPLGSSARPRAPLGVLGAWNYRRETAWPSAWRSTGETEDFTKADAAYVAEGSDQIAVIDDFLSKEALAEVRAFALESTLYWEPSAGGYVGAYARHGFSSPLLLDVADELRERLPNILGGLELTNLWAYAYANADERRAGGETDTIAEGIGNHVDPAAVNINLWITPDSANLEPFPSKNHGGIAVYTVSPPADDDRYMEWNHAPLVEANLDRLFPDRSAMEKLKTETPYRQNRAVVFCSDYVHHSVPSHFKSGHANRRINLTFLFGTSKRLNQRPKLPDDPHNDDHRDDPRDVDAPQTTTTPHAAADDTPPRATSHTPSPTSQPTSRGEPPSRLLKLRALHDQPSL